MQTDDEQGRVAATEAEARTAEAGGSSILDEIREIRAEKANGEARLFVLDIPAYTDANGKPRLAVIYRYPEQGQEAVMAAVQRERQGLRQGDAAKRLEGASDCLLAACASVVGRRVDGALVDALTGAPLGTDARPELPERPLRFGNALAKSFEIDVPEEVRNKPRFILRNLFSPRGLSQGEYEGDVAIITASDLVFGFINGADFELDSETVGE